MCQIGKIELAQVSSVLARLDVLGIDLGTDDLGHGALPEDQEIKLRLGTTDVSARSINKLQVSIPPHDRARGVCRDLVSSDPLHQIAGSEPRTRPRRSIALDIELRIGQKSRLFSLALD